VSELTAALGDKARGLRIEKCIIESMGWRPSTKEENIKSDIDAWTQKGTSVSIKSIARATFERRGNLAFELRVEHRERGWEKSWWYTGAATKYVFHIEGGRLYVVDKKQLRLWVAAHGWERVTSHRPETRAKQLAMGHAHLNAEVGLVRLQTLLDSGVAAVLKSEKAKQAENCK